MSYEQLTDLDSADSFWVIWLLRHTARSKRVPPLHLTLS
jgi:hypothetical protein